MKAKFLTEAVFLLVLTAVFQYFMIEALTSGHELLNVYSGAVASGGTQEQIDAALEEHHEAAITFMKDMVITEYLSIISFFYPLRILLEMMFATKTNRSLKFFTLTNVIDLAFAFCFSIRLGREYHVYQNGLDQYDNEGQKAIRYFENIYEFEDDEVLLDVLYSIAIGALWIRILYMFRLTRFLGPLLKMVYMMIWDITIFMILFGILLIIYASIGTLLFYGVEEYKDFFAAIITLFSSALGNFDMAILEDTNKGQLVGEIFIVSFIIFCHILLLNLLIAILTSTYGLFEQKKLVLYINEILRLRQSLEYHSKSSGLVSASPPWNIFPLVLSPLYFIMNDTRKLNEIVCHI